MSKIKNCVICGSLPKLIHCGDQKQYVTYICSKCFWSPVPLDEASLTSYDAEQRWNKRTEEAKNIISKYLYHRASSIKDIKPQGITCIHKNICTDTITRLTFIEYGDCDHYINEELVAVFRRENNEM